jgi:hypothetical protein
MTTTMRDIPRDIELKLVSLMNIDTRRALGIYTKLKVPLSIQTMVSQCFHKKTYSHGYACVRLGPQRLFDFEASYVDSMYILTRDCVHNIYYVEHIGTHLNTDMNFYSMYFVQSYC